MKIKKNKNIKFFIKNKILLNNHIFIIKNSSEIYYLYYKYFNKDIWKNIYNFLYPKNTQIIKWKQNHIKFSYSYISLFKYLYRNSSNLQLKKTEFVINFLKKRYNYLITVRDLYYLQHKLYQKDLNPERFVFKNNIIKYHSPSNL